MSLKKLSNDELKKRMNELQRQMNASLRGGRRFKRPATGAGRTYQQNRGAGRVIMQRAFSGVKAEMERRGMIKSAPKKNAKAKSGSPATDPRSKKGRVVLESHKSQDTRPKKTPEPKEAPKPKARPTTAKKSGMSAFQKAYAAARKSYKAGGKATFKFNGQSYTVATKEELKKAGGKYGSKLQKMLIAKQKKKPTSIAT